MSSYGAHTYTKLVDQNGTIKKIEICNVFSSLHTHKQVKRAHYWRSKPEILIIVISKTSFRYVDTALRRSCYYCCCCDIDIYLVVYVEEFLLEV